jgi:molybdopterin synthase sulfur carrier subunit
MSITVKYFASLREQTGISERDIQLTTGMTVSDVWKATSEGLAMPDNTLTAVNQAYVPKDVQLEDGDEVAFFPPVTGG